MNEIRQMLNVYFIMGSQDCPNEKPEEVLRKAMAGGITCFQFREKHPRLHMHQAVELGKRLRAMCKNHSIPFIVNDRVDLALILEADGVHIGQEDLPVQEARKLIGHNRILGVSAKTPAEALAARRDGADYIGVGPMFVTMSKQDAGQAIGPGRITEIRKTVGAEFPIVGIGGIHPQNAKLVLEAGADGVAVISAISRSDSPKTAAQKLKMLIG
ncbi:thiamine phosphate synthase [Thermoactinomyces mirandus]|uniref:Thiamine-phosphate synthase n=1 Tax=Thermoactinomyces mirandus TaxID=2756294 RepID=A0A7W1XQY3_9BACL|nr:thiamine phosphate synthase [Thermoactinomyces mirandus]MBA4601662.1 thiamine phosphate synthase [Thermoactinomyces mirandus]